MSKERQALADMLEYMPLIVVYEGEMVRVTLENYEKVTGKKLPD